MMPLLFLMETNKKRYNCPESGQSFGKNSKQFTSNEVFGNLLFTSQLTLIDMEGVSRRKVKFCTLKIKSINILNFKTNRMIKLF